MSTIDTARLEEQVLETPFCHTQLVALRFGRLVNELQYQIELAWLISGNAENRIRELWSELRLLSRVLTDVEMERQSWSTILTDAQDFWESLFLKEWHVDIQVAMRIDLDLIAQDRTTLSGACTVADVFDEAIFGITRFLTQLGNILIFASAHQHKETMSLGHRLDQIFHLARPRKYLLIQRDSCSQSNAGWDCVSPVSQERGQFRIEPPARPTDISTELDVELRSRWRQLGFSGSDFPILMNDNPSEAACQIESAMEMQLGRVVYPTPFAEPGFLGLSVNGIEVHRHSYHPVEVNTRLNLALIERLIDSGNRPASLHELTEAWEAMGGNEPTPEPGTIRVQISRVNPFLRPLGIQIINMRNVGWRLTEIADLNE